MTPEEAGALAPPSPAGDRRGPGGRRGQTDRGGDRRASSATPTPSASTWRSSSGRGSWWPPAAAPTGPGDRPTTGDALAAPHAVAAIGHRELVRLLLELVRRTGTDEDQFETFGWEQGQGPVGRAAPPECLPAAFAGLGLAPVEVTPEPARLSRAIPGRRSSTRRSASRRRAGPGPRRDAPDRPDGAAGASPIATGPIRSPY